MDWFIPDSVIRHDPDTLRRMRLLVVSIGVVVPLFLIAAYELFSEGEMFVQQGVAMLITAAVLLICPFVLKATRSHVAVGTLFCVSFIVLQFYLAMTDAGLADSSLYWVPLVPLMAAFMVGLRTAALCVALILFEIGVLYVLETQGYPFPRVSDYSGRAWFTMLALVCATGFAGFLSWLYEGYTLKRLRRMNARLKGLQGALEASEARYRSLFQNIPVGVYQSAADGRVLMANDAFLDMMGLDDYNDLAGVDLETVYVEPGGRDRFHELITRDGIVGQFETALRRKDGRQIYVRDNARATFDEDGNVLYYEGTIEDVTEQRRAKQALRVSEERFRALVQHSSDTITVVDREGIIQYQSPSVEGHLGYAPEDIVGTNMLDLAHPDDRARLGVLFDRAVQQAGEFGAIEFRAEHVEGHYVYVEAVGSNMLDNPWVNGVVLNSRDVTERKRSEVALVHAKEQAEEVARMKSAFLANMSHEIRTPLTGILGFADVLSEEVEDEHREFVHLIERSGQRLLETLNSVLDLARLEAEHVEIDVEPLDVGAHIAEAVQLLLPLAEERGLRLEADIQAPGVQAELDSGCLGRILNNLVGNAIKFTEAGSITVRVQREGQRVVVRVEDTGVGIDEAFLPQLFEEFKQESTGVGRSHEGSGLGLAITRRLVSLMHGTLEVESTKGKGSAFTVSFPLADPASHCVIDVAAGPAVATDWRPRVLAVDDNEDTRLLLERVLHGEYEVDTASGVNPALERAKATPYDVVLMDIHLSDDTSGTDLMLRVRELPGYADTPVIAFTAFALPGDRERFLNMGFTDYLSKPFTRRELRKMLAGVLTSDEGAFSASLGDGAAPEVEKQASVGR